MGRALPPSPQRVYFSKVNNYCCIIIFLKKYVIYVVVTLQHYGTYGGVVNHWSKFCLIENSSFGILKILAVATG